MLSYFVDVSAVIAREKVSTVSLPEKKVIESVVHNEYALRAIMNALALSCDFNHLIYGMATIVKSKLLA